ncbi:hypothetical protein [Streptomyces tsukubensis]|uniref:hypothetical protein n=1 Tax=Streptomyces tsukubensis TaxID=83656 RepID=UPI00344D90BF
MTLYTVDRNIAPALGDIRSAGPEDCIYVLAEVALRADFPKIWEAAGVALARGAFVHVVNREESSDGH